VLAGLVYHPIGLRFRIGKQPVRLGTRMVQQRVRLGGRRRHHGFGVRLGVVQHRIARIQHVLGVIQLTRDRIFDVVDQLQHVTAGHHTTGSHGHTAGFFDNGAQFIQRFKDSVHGHTLLASVVVTSVPGVTSVTAVATPVCRDWHQRLATQAILPGLLRRRLRRPARGDGRVANRIAIG
jgi:hypothetical protein